MTLSLAKFIGGSPLERRLVDAGLGSGPQAIARAPASRLFPDEDAAFHEIIDVAQGRVLGALGDLRPFGRGELAGEPVEEAVEHRPLALIERSPRYTLPEPGLAENGREGLFGVAQGIVQDLQEPGEPLRDVEIAFLRSLERFVIRIPLDPQ